MLDHCFSATPELRLFFQDKTDMQVWIGSRDDLFEDTQQVGFICAWETEGVPQRAFLPTFDHLSPEQAQALTEYMLKLAGQQDFETVMRFAQAVAAQPTLPQIPPPDFDR